MHRVAAAVKQAAGGQAAGGAILRLDLPVLAVQDGHGDAAQRGQRGIDQRPQVVRMDHRRLQSTDRLRQRQDAARREAVLFAQQGDSPRVWQAVGEAAAFAQTRNMSVNLVGYELIGHVYHPVFHPAGIEGINHVQHGKVQFVRFV